MAFAIAVVVIGSAVPAQAQTAALYLNSQPGDYIGAGLTQTYTTVDGTFFDSTTNGTQHASLSFHTPMSVVGSSIRYFSAAAPPPMMMTVARRLRA